MTLAGIRVGDEPLEPDQVYTVAINGFLRQGRGGFSFKDRESRDHGDLAGAVIKELRNPSGPDLKDLAEPNLIIFGSRAAAEEQKSLAEKTRSVEPAPTE